MDITRHGAFRNRGTTDLVSNLSLYKGDKPDWRSNVSWNEYYKKIVISGLLIPYQDGVTHHDYKIYLSLEDVSALITIFGHAASEGNAGLLRDLLGKNIPALVKLLACATGLVPVPIADQVDASQ